MLTISRNNREEIEKEFMALLLNKNELIGLIQIKPQYLNNDDNKSLLKYMIECYELYEVVSPVKIMELHNDFDSEYFMSVYTNTFYYNKNWKEQLKVSEESIVKFYKEDVIKYLNEEIKKNQISYDDFMKKMKKLDDIQLVENTPMLTQKEIVENINTDNVMINFRSFGKLNKLLKLSQGDFMIIGATTGAGKSGFMMNLMNDLMREYQCIYFNMEMSKSTIYRRLISIQAEIKMDDVMNPKTDHQKSIVEKSMIELEEAGLIIDHKANDIKQIRALVGKLKDKDRHTILFVDHLGLTRCDDKKNLYEQATEVAKQLRQICLEYDCTVISASQLNRGAYNSEELSLSMLKDSGELENSASKVILLYRNKNESKENVQVKMNIEIAKNRDGICGIVEMNYDKEKQVFREIYG